MKDEYSEICTKFDNLSDKIKYVDQNLIYYFQIPLNNWAYVGDISSSDGILIILGEIVSHNFGERHANN